MSFLHLKFVRNHDLLKFAQGKMDASHELRLRQRKQIKWIPFPESLCAFSFINGAIVDMGNFRLRCSFQVMA